MKKKLTMKLFSVVLAMTMLLTYMPQAAFADMMDTTAEQPVNAEETADYAQFLSNLQVLETYASQYAENNSKMDETELVLNYIRTGIEKYCDGSWNVIAGEPNTEFVNYVAEQDAQNGTKAAALRNLKEFTLPNGDEAEFGHMFGSMNIIYKTGRTDSENADMGTWAGDICDLMEYANTKGVEATDAETLKAEIKEKYFGIDDPEYHTFGYQDLYGDLDAFYLMSRIMKSSSQLKLSRVMESYFTDSLTNKARAAYFVKNRFGGTEDQAATRSIVLSEYQKNTGVAALESSRALSSLENVETLRTACCYVFADWLFEQAGSTETSEENPYYTVFKKSTSTLAPGVTQEIRQATTADNKQIVYYIATADLCRDDVNIEANYKDHQGGPPWGMQRVTDQMAAAKAQHSNAADSENYIENYTPVVGINADFYNMTNGMPSGALIIDGKQYSGLGSENFFGILKNGTPVIGGSAEWSKYQSQLQQAVGASILLVKDGKSLYTSGDNYYNSRASRTAVGITEDNRVVMVALDGRQEPVSAGASAQELAQVMIDAGCVIAVNLDGGGSTTYAAKEEGSDEVAVVNRPSDGYERSVSSSLMIVSTARSSTEFDHAVISVESEYLTVGSSVAVSVSGVSASGNAAALPEGTETKISDAGIGTLANGKFTATAVGDVSITVEADGKVLGKKALHVVVPTKIAFSKESVNATYGVPCAMPVVVTYNGIPVKINENDVTFGFIENNQPVLTSKAGTFQGFDFIGDAESGIRVVKAGVLLGKDMSAVSDPDKIAMITINLYNADEAAFDFDNATGGNRNLAWNRSVTNSTTKDENLYYIVEQGKDMVTSYTFAVDMTTIPISEKIKPMLSLLPGGDSADATAWGFLLQLAERVSVLTNVKATLNIDENFDVDISGLKVANEYFELKEAVYDDTAHTVTIVMNFKDQTQAIDAETANPICVLSGIKLTPKNDAKWVNDRLTPKVTGKLDYDIYLRSSAVYGIASNKDNQEKYGIYPYESEDILYNGSPEKGAHFYDDFVEFTDTYVLDKSCKDGWVQENGNYYYYRNNEVLTGIHELPDHEGSQKTFYYDLGTDGVSKGKISGLFELNGYKYFAKNGVRQTGWQTDGIGENVKNYYFDTTTYRAVDGVQTIKGYHYIFTDCVLTRGDLIQANRTTRYMWAGAWASQTWHTIDGNQYYFRSNYEAATGIYAFNIDAKNVFYLFDETGIWQENFTGRYTDADGYTFWIEQGIKNVYPGLIFDESDGYYYYFKYNEGNVLGSMVKNGTFWVGKTNDLMNVGNYKFDEQGRMMDPDPSAKPEVTITWKNEDGSILKVSHVQKGTLPAYDGTPTKAENARYTYEFIGWDKEITVAEKSTVYTAQYKAVGKNGLCVEGNETYWIQDGMNVEYPGLVKVQDAEGHNLYYYFAEEGKAVKNVPFGGQDYWVEKTNGLLPQWGYYFDENGVILHDDAFQNGIAKDQDGALCYYIDGIKVHMGMIRIGDDYYYVRSSGKLVVNGSYYCTNMNGLMEEGTYKFDQDGKLIKPEPAKNGIVSENGSLYYYVDGKLTYAGLIQIGDSYYYVRTNGEVVHGQNYWISKTNGLLPEKSYTFDEDGRILLPDTSKNGIFAENDSLYYYKDGLLTYAGLVQIDGSYYYVGTNGEVVHSRTYWITKTNDLMPEKSYSFADDGKMQDPEIKDNSKSGIVAEDGSLYYYVDGLRNYAGLIQIDGSYYYVKTSGEVVHGRTYWITKTNGLLPEKSYSFADDGKMTIE